MPTVFRDRTERPGRRFTRDIIDAQITREADQRERALQRLCRERLKQGIAEQFGMPLIERSVRIIEDAEMLLAERRLERAAVDVRTFAYQLVPTAWSNYGYTHGYTDTRNTITNIEYRLIDWPDTTARLATVVPNAAEAIRDFSTRIAATTAAFRQPAVWLTNQPVIYHGDGYLRTRYDWATGTNSVTDYHFYSTAPIEYTTVSSMTSQYIAPTWTRHAGQQYAVTITDEMIRRGNWGVDQNETWAAWNRTRDVGVGFQPDVVWHTWQSTYQRHNVGSEIPEGHVWDPTLRRYVDEDTYNEQQILRQCAADERREREQARILERERADTRADQLLRMILTEHQIKQWDENKEITVRSQHGKTFKVRKGWAGNVIEMDERTGRRRASYCIHPNRSMPEADNVAAQILMLQTDEEKFLAIANRGAI